MLHYNYAIDMIRYVECLVKEMGQLGEEFTEYFNSLRISSYHLTTLTPCSGVTAVVWKSSNINNEYNMCVLKAIFPRNNYPNSSIATVIAGNQVENIAIH